MKPTSRKRYTRAKIKKWRTEMTKVGGDIIIIMVKKKGRRGKCMMITRVLEKALNRVRCQNSK